MTVGSFVLRLSPKGLAPTVYARERSIELKMKVAERTHVAFQRGIPDRVPIHSWLGLPLIQTLKPPHKTMREMLEWCRMK